MEILEVQKQRPILFSTPMVQALLQGRKTQTRRIMKPPVNGDFWKFSYMDANHAYLKADLKPASYVSRKCPYGNAGDVLWVRETMIKNDGYTYWPLADGYKKNTPLDKTIPSIFMPKAACRLFLEITDIRVERLKDISEEDAKAEGAEGLLCQYVNDEWNQGYTSHYEGFKKLWHSINGEESWNQNPFVWVISFKKIPQP